MSDRVTDVRISECWAASAAAAVVDIRAARTAWGRVCCSDWCPGSFCCLPLRITCDFEARGTDASSLCLDWLWYRRHRYIRRSERDRTSPQTMGPGPGPERSWYWYLIQLDL